MERRGKGKNVNTRSNVEDRERRRAVTITRRTSGRSSVGEGGYALFEFPIESRSTYTQS